MRNALLRAASILVALSLFTFLLADWIPGDYLSTQRVNPDVSPATIEAMRARLELDRPWHVRFGEWWMSALQGDFGQSLAYGIPVGRLLGDRVGVTLLLNITATGAAWLLALLFGGWAAQRPGGWLDGAVRLLGATLLGLPEILLALLGLWLFGSHAALPYVILTLGALPTLLTHVRSTTGAALEDTSVQAARLHGIRTPRLWLSYVLPVAAPPLLSLAALSVGGVLSASLLVEAALGIPGLGTLLLDAIQARDTAVVATVVALSGALMTLSQLAADLLRRACDPRLRSTVS